MSAWLATLALACFPQDLPPAQPGALAYAAHQFDVAFETYERALADPAAARGALLYNLGNCAYRLDRPVEATLWYRRALRYLPRDPELRFNLAFAEARLGVDNAPTSLAATAAALAASFTPGELLALTAGLQALGLASLLFLRRKHLARPLGAALVALGLLAAIPLVHEALFGAAPEGVVLAPDLSLHPAPDPTLAPSTHLSAGEVVCVVEQTDDWLRVEHRRGVGWAPRAAVGVIE
jgi:tetratricopeptide (TPR) repeat protein